VSKFCLFACAYACIVWVKTNERSMLGVTLASCAAHGTIHETTKCRILVGPSATTISFIVRERPKNGRDAHIGCQHLRRERMPTFNPEFDPIHGLICWTCLLVHGRIRTIRQEQLVASWLIIIFARILSQVKKNTMQRQESVQFGKLDDHSQRGC